MVVVGVLVVLLGAIQAYEVPDVKIEVHQPKGFSASIPDSPGIGLFSFNANVNNAISNQDVGDISGEVLQPSGGRWVFRNEGVELKKGDVLHYWVMVSHNRLGYLKDDLQFEYNGELSPIPTSVPTDDKLGTNTHAPCTPSVTTVRGQSTCSGQVIFQDTFDQLSSNWQIEHQIPYLHPDYPFVSYQNLDSVIRVSDGKLRITPTLQQTLVPHSVDTIQAGTLDLFRGCTESADACTLTASGSDILPPVVSGRVNTKYSFTFKYGVVDIRAKLIRGDWLYPELLLEPFMSKYGREAFSSGTVIVGTALGNQELRSGTDQIGNTRVLGGAVVDRFHCHDNLTYSKMGQPWSGDYHNYTVRWGPDGLTWSVDGVEYGRLAAPADGLSQKLRGCPDMTSVFQRWAQGTKMAPFDQEFYLALGVSAGGITMFPDGSVTSLGHNKPWANRSSKAKLHFWQHLERWHRTWSVDSTLLVDSVKVTAL